MPSTLVINSTFKSRSEAEEAIKQKNPEAYIHKDWVDHARGIRVRDIVQNRPNTLPVVLGGYYYSEDGTYHSVQLNDYSG